MVWFAALAALLGPDGSDLPLHLKDETELRIPLYATQSDGFRIGLTLGAQARVSLPFGEADQGTIIISGNTVFIENTIDYSELFNVGTGFTLEADLMFRPLAPPEVAPRYRPTDLGGFVAFEWDSYGGSSTRDQTGTTIRPDALRIPSVFVGVKGAGWVYEHFFGDLRFGLGAVHYPSLKADFAPGGRGELFAESWEFAMEIRMHFGWKLGPLGLVFGMGGRLLTPPSPGSQSSLDPGILFTLDFDVGAEIGF
jgi:hypothetical protein